VVIHGTDEHWGDSGIMVVAVMPLGVFLSLVTMHLMSCHLALEAEAGKMCLMRSCHAVRRQEMGGDLCPWWMALLQLQEYFHLGSQWLQPRAC
jgi:hypothetical protein